MSTKNLKMVPLWTLLALCTCSLSYGRSHIYLGVATNFLFPAKKIKAKGCVPSSNNEISKNREGFKILASGLRNEVREHLIGSETIQKNAESHIPALNKAATEGNAKKTTEEAGAMYNELIRDRNSDGNLKFEGVDNDLVRPLIGGPLITDTIRNVLTTKDALYGPADVTRKYGPLTTKPLSNENPLARGEDNDDHWLGSLAGWNDVIGPINLRIDQIANQATKPETREHLRSHLLNLAKARVDRARIDGERLVYDRSTRIQVERDQSILSLNTTKLESACLYVTEVNNPRKEAALDALGALAQKAQKGGWSENTLLCENLDGEYDIEHSNPMTSFDISGMLLALFDLNDMLSVGVNVSIGYSLREFKLKNTPIKMTESLVGKLAFVLGITDYLQLHLGVGVTKRLVGIEKYDEWDKDYELVKKMSKDPGLKYFGGGNLGGNLDPDDTCDHVALFWNVSVLAIYPFNENFHGFVSAGYQSDFNNFVGDLGGSVGSKLELDGLSHFTFGLGILFKVQ